MSDPQISEIIIHKVYRITKLLCLYVTSNSTPTKLRFETTYMYQTKY